MRRVNFWGLGEELSEVVDAQRLSSHHSVDNEVGEANKIDLHKTHARKT